MFLLVPSPSKKSRCCQLLPLSHSQRNLISALTILLVLGGSQQVVISVRGHPQHATLQETVVNAKSSDNPNVNVTVTSEVCECIEYWNCTARNGQFHTYCGISDSEVCCYFGTSNPSAITLSVTTNANDSNFESGTTGAVNVTVWSSPIPNSKNRIIRPCGIASIPGNLDSVAEFREWPWHVGILEAKDDLYICGGSIISSRFVLTAAHCVSSYVHGKIPRIKIRAGEFDVSTNLEPSPHAELLVKSVKLHPNYSNSSLINDIALLELVRHIPLRYRDNIGLICLPQANQSNVTPPGRCIVTGWGRLNEQSDHSVRMKEVIVPIWDRDQCQKKLRRNFGPNYILPETSMCAGDEGRDACDGDGGGPLVCFQSGKWVQHGVVSFGVGCGRPELPGVYTKVSSFIDWINSEVNH